MSPFRKWIHLALTTLFIQGHLLASPSLIISSISDSNSPQWRRDLPVVKGKIRRWLPETHQRQWEVKEVVADGFDKTRFLMRGVDHSLERLEIRFEKKTPSYPEAVRELKAVRGDIEELTGSGQFRARYHRLLALAASAESKHALVENHLSEALKQVPAEVLEAFSHRFGALAGKMKALGRRLMRCRYELGMDSEMASVAVNGFVLGRVHEFHLPLGQHMIEVDAPLFAKQEKVLLCQRPGMARLEFAMVRDERQPPNPTTNPEVRLWVKEEGEKIRLFLETPGVAFDEVTQSKAIATADLVRNPTFETDAPVSEFQELLGLHLAAAEMKRGPVNPTLIENGEIASVPAWYQDWRFWTVAGVVASGVALSFLVKDRGRVDTTH